MIVGRSGVVAGLKSFVAALLRSAKAVDRKADLFGARALGWLGRPRGLAVLGVVMVAVLTVAIRINSPWVPTGGAIHMTAPCIARMLAGGVFLVVLFRLIELRDPGAACWWVGPLAAGLMPLFFMDGMALSVGMTWGELMSVGITCAESNGLKSVDPDTLAVGICVVLLAVLPGIAPFLVSFLLKRADPEIMKALEGRK